MKKLKTTTEIWAEINARQEEIYQLNFDIDRSIDRIRELNLEINKLSKQLHESLIS